MKSSLSNKSKEMTKNHPSILKKPSSSTTISKESKVTHLPMTEEEKKVRRDIIEPIHQFECLRNVLLQWVFINNYFKEHKEALKRRMEIEFYDRTQQILQLQERAMEMKLSINTEEAIKELESILSFEYHSSGEVSSKIHDLEEHLDILKEYMENALKRIEVGENIVIDPERFNEDLVMIKTKLEDIQNRYLTQWQASETIEAKMKEYIELILEEHNELISLIIIMTQRQDAIEKKNFEDYTNFQERQIQSLEFLIFSDV